jgi:hypothetical protein
MQFKQHRRLARQLRQRAENLRKAAAEIAAIANELGRQAAALISELDAAEAPGPEGADRDGAPES